ncbi:DET1 homolog [Cimex lectularius]|uniref:DET1 homolog n=1 Tax=Cimex lectularius TaxID=79782 RepID=A0A8I6RWD3_CIMLE|nr:DET1 homolog [Cimex lectularius]
MQFDGIPNYFNKRRVKSQNIVDKLRTRELFGEVKMGTSMYVNRSFYENVVPDYTIVNVEKPPCFLRKFSPDGRYFIAFSADQTCVEIYLYEGSTSLNGILNTCVNEQLAFKADPLNDYIRLVAFEYLFKCKFCVPVAPRGQQLNRECSLFTQDGQHVIVGAAAFITDDNRPNFYDVYTNNEAVTPNPRSPLEDYSIHIVHIQSGKLCDSINFKTDKIYLSHNQGIYLYEETLAVLSVQHQTIHIYHVRKGRFVLMKKIGQFVYSQDNSMFYNTYCDSRDPTEIEALQRPYRSKILSGLKHRILAYLFRTLVRSSMPCCRYKRLRKFYESFDYIKSLRMWKMQLLDEDHLLVKYASEEVVTLKVSEPNSHASFFIIYNIRSTKILRFYDCKTKELVELFENFCDHFRNARPPTGGPIMSSPSNNVYARINQLRFKQTIVGAKYGGLVEARKRILAQLPISAQSYSCSPYLDLSLFSYDDKWISAMERPKACGEHPIRFYSRQSGLLKFQIYAGVIGRSPPPAARRLVAFTFHPTEPFAISVQRTNSDYVVNFHLRLPT